MWAPVSAGATLAVYLAIFVWQVTSVSSIESSLPTGFPMLAMAVFIVLTPSPSPWFQVLVALIALAVAAVLGLAQGILLARIFERRSIVGLWLVANLVGAVLMGIIFGIRFREPATSNDANLTFFVSTALIDGGLYAAVTGAVLVAIARRNGEIPARAEA
jgi:thiol:disulfide interchange protein